MRPHTVHAKTDYSEILATPVESAVEVPLLLIATVLCARHIAEEMASRHAHESTAILELMAETDRLVLIHMKIVVGVVVPFKKLDETE